MRHIKIKTLVITFIGLVFLGFLAYAGERVEKDLIAIDSTWEPALKTNAMPYTWKSTTYVIGEWTAAQQNQMKLLNIPFQILVAPIQEEQVFYIIELKQTQKVPDELNSKIVYRNGKDIIIELNADAIDQWIDKGYDVIRLMHKDYFFKDKAALVPYTCTYNSVTNDLISRTSQNQWVDWIEKISGVDTVVLGGTTYTINRRQSGNLFNGDINAKAYDFILWQSQQYHYGSNIEEDAFSYSGSTWKNLVLTIPGQTTPNDIVAISAHLDDAPGSGVAPGADDNASGSAMLLEAARLLRQFRYQRTIKIIWFTGEEQGLIGSAHYVGDHSMTNMLGVINGDMFGYDPNGNKCFELHVGTLSASNDVGTCMSNTITAYSIDLTRDFITNGAITASDHASFWNVNVGAIEILENNEPTGSTCGPVEDNPYYHTSGDTLANDVTLPYSYDISRDGLGSISGMAIPIQACFTTAPSLTTTPGIFKVDLSWTSVTGAISYRIYRSTQSCYGQWFEQASTTGTTWTDNNVTAGTTYYYYVEAVASDGFCVSKMSNCTTAVPTTGPHIVYSSNTITDSCSSGGAGNNNGVIEPGETITTDVTIRNDGNTNLTGVSGVLSTATPGITMTTGSATFPNINTGATASCNAPHYIYQVGTGVTCGTSINFDLAMSYTQGSNNTSFAHTVGTTNIIMKLNENFATGNPPTGWQVVDGGTGGGTAATWTTTNPGARTPGTPLVAPFEIVDSYFAGSSATQNEQLLTPALDLTGCTKVTLEFDNQFRYRSGGQNEIADVDITTNGTTWTNVLRMQGASNGYPTPTIRTIDITSVVAPAPASVKIRWHYYQAQNEYWWAIDNVKVTCETPVCTTCTGGNHPGNVLNMLTIVKSGTDLNLNWQPNSLCTVSGYGLYRGTLPWTAYNHASVNCSITGTSTNTPQDTGSYFYLIVPYASTSEGSYGTDSSGTQRPQGTSPCRTTQDTNPC